MRPDNHRNHPELRHVSSLHYRLRHQSCQTAPPVLSDCATTEERKMKLKKQSTRFSISSDSPFSWALHFSGSSNSQVLHFPGLPQVLHFSRSCISPRPPFPESCISSGPAFPRSFNSSGSPFFLPLQFLGPPFPQVLYFPSSAFLHTIHFP